MYVFITIQYACHVIYGCYMLLLFLVPPRRSPPATAELLQESFRACVSSGRKIAQWTLSVPVEPSQCKASRDCALTVPKVRELTVPKNREFTKIEIYLGNFGDINGKTHTKRGGTSIYCLLGSLR